MSKPARLVPIYGRMYVAAVVIALLSAMLIISMLQFAHSQYMREQQNWEVKLNLIADSRAEAVSTWLDARMSDIEGLAANASLQLYMTELADETSPAGEDTSAQQVYLHHLLTITSERGGFTKSEGDTVVPANIELAGSGGVALVGKDNKILVGTSKVPPLQGGLLEFVASAKPGASHVLDLYESGADLQMAFLAPIYAIQGDAKPSDQIGWVLGVRPVGKDLFHLLKHPGTTETTLENLLVRQEKEGVRYVSPLADGTAALKKYLSTPVDARKSNAIAEAYAIANPGGIAVRRDYATRDVLVTGRKIAGTEWTLVTKVGEDEALHDAKAQYRNLVVSSLLVTLVIVFFVIAAWRHGASRNALLLARRLETTLAQSKSREHMLAVITDSQPGALFMVDKRNRCWFANEAMAKQAGANPWDIPGKPLENLIGPALAEQYHQVSRQALDSLEVVSWTRLQKGEANQDNIIRVKHIPLRHLPIDTHSPEENTPGVLIIEQDITSVVQERERRLKTLRGLINTLVAMVDKRDPYASNHSAMVANVARHIAADMELENSIVETAETAGNLMNIGKMVVPSEWLTKSGVLNEKERKAIRDSLLASAEMLEGVEFEGPVAETLRQSIENWDGSGPAQKKGDEILVTARIIAAANAFVGMVSPRSYRKAITVEEALKTLIKGMDKEYDRKVVIALANYIDNHGGREFIQRTQKQSA